MNIPVAIISAIALLGSSLVGAWGISSKQVAVVEERQKNQYEELKSLVKANDERQNQRWSEVKGVLDRIAPPTVPTAKADTFSTQKERAESKAPLIMGTDANGPINE